MEKMKMVGGGGGTVNSPEGMMSSSHQPLLQGSPVSPSPHRRPLLDQRQELYGATRPPPPNHAHHYHHQQPRSPQHPEHQPVPPGYNVDVHNAYLRRTAERQQIYQNHCNVVYRQPEPESLYPRHLSSNTELLRQQYNEIQQMKLQQQMHYQNQAQMQQQQVFAQRQLLLQHVHGLKVPSNVQTPLHHMDFGQQLQKLELDKRHFETADYNRGPKKVGAVAPLSPGPKSPEVSSPSLKSPTSSESRRSSGSNSTVLKSPIAQRLPSAPVTMSGWLYKQGSDGLKVWRKRWFVLTEYCLFYYKNHEEDKLLGSILLPSYSVSICKPEERVGKKFAFKCEHANMRTYVLAAMDQESMNKWMKTLIMASLMQEGSVSKGQHNESSQSPTGEETNELPGGRQPTYANAPPKPRRSNEGYGSPSPERYDPNYDLLRNPPSINDGQRNATSPVSAESDNIYESKYRSKIPSSVPNRQNLNEPAYNAQNLSLLLTNTASDRLETAVANNRHPHGYRDTRGKSPMNFEGRHSKLGGRMSSEPRDAHADDRSNEDAVRRVGEVRNASVSKHFENRDVQASHDKLPVERRTPDAYGRSPVIPGYYNNKGRACDYEDIYNLNYKNGNNAVEMSYETPTSPTIYDKRTPSQHNSQTYTSSNDAFGGSSVVRRKKSPSLNSQPSTVPRPHSADFLEYETANPQQSSSVQSRRHGNAARQPQPPRPKSSLDINSRLEHAPDNYYYSEASYAEKMRQSALYLQNKGNPLLNSKAGAAKTPNDYGNPSNGYNYDSEVRSRADGRSSTERSLSDAKYTDSGTNSWTKDKKALNRINQSESFNRSNSAMSEGVASVANGYNRELDVTESNENFMRSASARLPAGLYDEFESADGERKVQQREESMKRLLEWKQRMLQSPLTRKSTPNTLMLSRNLNQTKLATYQQKNTDALQQYTAGQIYPKAGAKFASHINNSYNSFSSDDEASMSASGKGMDPVNRTPIGAANKKPFMGSNPSLGRATRETIPVRAVSPRIRWKQQDQNAELWNQQINQPYSQDENWSGSRTSLKQPQQPVRVVSPRVRRVPDNEMAINSTVPNGHTSDVEQLLGIQNITAGELLGRTHEELVLLLIQLRRRHIATANSIEQSALHIHNIQDNLGVSNGSERQENLQRLDQLKHQLVDLEKQYQKSKPLVHLVDNMVKLGSLYNRPGSSLPSTIDRLEYNQQLREKLLLRQQEDQRRWAESLSSLSAAEIQERVDELWSLHRQAAGEAATLRSLQRDHLLNGVRRMPGDHLEGVNDPISPTVEDGGALEADLSRVHMMLAQNSKKLEQTVADNARLERELMALRQKLHKHRISETVQTNNPNNNYSANNSATALLEDEVVRVQALVSHLQSQRQLLAAALRSPSAADAAPFNRHALDYSISPPHRNYHPHAPEEPLPHMPIIATNLVPANHKQSLAPRKPVQQMPALGISPTCHNAVQDIGSIKKRNPNGWLETDLDSGAVTEHPEYGICLNNTLNIPLYVETTADDGNHQNAFGNLSNVEKQEIKTVRIVKRESERRQRERSLQPDWTPTTGSQNLDQLIDDDYTMAYYGSRGNGLVRNYHSQQQIDVTAQQLDPVLSPMEGKKFPSSPSLSVNSLSDYGVLGKSVAGTSGGVVNGESSPIFKSEAAREILMEMSAVDEASSRRRAIPKVKRRHYTAPHHLSTNTLSNLNDDDSAFYQQKVGRSLDDADLERALRGDRPREVVRASAAPTAHFSSSTIDQLLAAPTKIVIPERYVPEQAPELSPEEEKKRREKVESIRKMLSGTTTTETGKSPIEDNKKQREHLLQLNQILAKQVMEMSKIVASSGAEVSQANSSHDTS